MILDKVRSALSGSGDYRRFLVQKLPEGGVGCEIGVWKGDFSELILREGRVSQLHLVDPWEFRADLPNTWHGGAVADGQQAMDQIHDDVVARFAHDDRVVVHRLRAEELDGAFEDGRFDWMYIDGDHRYEAVRDDLAMALRKVKPGGVIAGDDYGRKARTVAISPVQRAVDEFIAEQGFTDHWVRRHQFFIQR